MKAAYWNNDNIIKTCSSKKGKRPDKTYFSQNQQQRKNKNTTHVSIYMYLPNTQTHLHDTYKFLRKKNKNHSMLVLTKWVGFEKEIFFWTYLNPLWMTRRSPKHVRRFQMSVIPKKVPRNGWCAQLRETLWVAVGVLKILQNKIINFVRIL